MLRFASGALGLLDGSRVAGYGFETGVEVVGSAATARVPGGAPTAWSCCRRAAPGRGS